MGLDITFTQRKQIVCPACGETIGHIDVRSVDSGGRGWYPFLESIGYYVPHDQRTEKNDWYGKDMVLTDKRAKEVGRFAVDETPYNWLGVANLVKEALDANDDVVINADW